MKALIVYGGWDGHEPEPVSKIIEKALVAKGFEVDRVGGLEPLAGGEALKQLDLICPIWTMGQMTGEQWQGLNEAIRSGVGFGGFHGGAGDAFRGNLEFQWMVGGQFVGHPHVGEYTVRMTAVKSPITDASPSMFTYSSEQYYQLIDPGVTVLADTLYEYDGNRIILPCVWTKTWGRGRVFYSALGHCAKEFSDYPDMLAMTIRGMIWAAEGKATCRG